ncbi:MAG: PEP-CTERM system histidine kinase PrsK [Sphingomonadales bacterium]
MSQIAFVSHAVAAFAFCMLTVILLSVWRRSTPGFWLILAAATSFAWALAVAAGASLFPAAAPLVPVLETLRTGSWVAFLISLLATIWRLEERRNYAFLLAVGINAVFALLLIVDVASWLGWFPDLAQISPSLVLLYLLGRMAGAVGGLALVENLYRQTPQNNRWGIQLLCLGVGLVFVYDIFLYADALLFRGINADWYGARGLVNALMVPLVAASAARNPSWKLDLHFSRRIVFHTLSLLATGAYLMVMAAAGYYLREFGGDWGTLLQVTFLVAALILLLVLAFSGRVRAQLRVFFAKHFFSYRYDYREVWLRFIRTVSDTSGALDLDHRVIQAVAEMVDSPGGALWLADQDDYALAARWNYRTAQGGREAADGPLAHFLTTKQWTIDLDALKAGADGYEGLEAPAWAADDAEAWLIVPLLHHERLIGFLLLQQPRAKRPLNWEDHDLLKTAGRQAASYLAEKQSQEALGQARQFEAFNRRFAFVMHDLKNLVSQLSLLVRNAERHADNPEFRADMLATLRSSVDKMNDLLAKLRQATDAVKRDERFALRPLLDTVVREKSAAHNSLTLSWQGDDVMLAGDRERLEQVFAHLLQNAIDASKADAPIVVEARPNGDWVEVDVVDRGCGMSEHFVRNELFRPFRSTKAAGYGIGAYEARELVKSLGGKLRVDSQVGQGTVMTVLLPCQAQATG